jgi:hypothetical protein
MQSDLLDLLDRPGRCSGSRPPGFDGEVAREEGSKGSPRSGRKPKLAADLDGAYRLQRRVREILWEQFRASG